jgi:hypothetical protein
VPSANGPDVFEQRHCADGEYLAAYTSEGIELWRRKIGGAGAPVATEMNKAAVATQQHSARLDTKSSSICDLVTVGIEQSKIRDLR